jgi:N-acetylmuramoyl-L-alanine amidase
VKIGNGLARWRRQRQFHRRRNSGERLPVLVSEGDSWFQFPIFIREIIDNLDDDYLIWSIGAAGDTAQNMVLNDIGRGKTEYLRALRSLKDEVRGFLFSAAGNDVIGEHPETGEPMLAELLHPFTPGITDPEDLINKTAYENVLVFLEGAYRTVIQNIRSEPGFEKLPIFIHGYDYAFPYPWGGEKNDPRSPLWAANNQWLGIALDSLGIEEDRLRRGVIISLIDQLYARFQKLADEDDRVFLVDCRGAMPELGDWADEIHGTSAGFARIAERFRRVISQNLLAIA